MLKTYLSMDYSSNYTSNYTPDIKESLFRELKVAKFERDLDNESWEQMLEEIKKRISALYKKHRYLMGILQGIDEEDFEKIIEGTIKDNVLLRNVLSLLARYLHELFDKNSIILIDEYDWPMENARGFYDKADNFFRIMYSSVVKLSLWIKQCSGLSIHEIQSCSDRAIFSDTFGFIKDEVKFLLERKHQSEKLNELRLYYYGY
ncbi:AAA family ATPase [Rhizophagus clarus]|uniref:AAA family ATPase n=1 Tax=Rhizophagus clarus TaxID=94130 RepID=A0A8H3KSG0_9GLOM|nr:AAA family ATPase [Rhizophagus clarus]